MAKKSKRVYKRSIKNWSEDGRPRPFLKCAGGKGQLLEEFQNFYPKKFNKYIEPFVGGGAVYFDLYSKGILKEAVLIDLNKDFIDCFIAVKNSREELLKLVRKHKECHSKTYYYKIRNEVRNNSQIWDKLELVERAAIIIYLNKTCFNGLYRVNRSDQFNVPMGSYKDPEIFDEKNLELASKALEIVYKIEPADFSKCLNYAEKGDFVYFDPPYNPMSKTANFTSYTKDSFGEDEQRRLADVFRKLDKKGCMVMLSNSKTNLIDKLYEGYRKEEVKANRFINSKPQGRGEITELVILNY